MRPLRRLDKETTVIKGKTGKFIIIEYGFDNFKQLVDKESIQAIEVSSEYNNDAWTHHVTFTLLYGSQVKAHLTDKGLEEIGEEIGERL